MKLRVVVIVIISTFLLAIVVTATNTLGFDEFEQTEAKPIEKCQHTMITKTTGIS
ncbi:hypothetical protein [Alkalibacillus filiformis]|uniref:hypothetical protein n=1 Tax=Alkalibacillus filiformis TaxID=200990 RepID=UPI0027D90A40|nr:hypothetical protein [Alkalibacillus filiformis]